MVVAPFLSGKRARPIATDCADTANMTRHIAVTPSPLGNLELIVENEALTVLAWTDAPAREAAHPLLQKAIDQLDAYFADGSAPFDLPLAPAGNDFERAVWRGMLEIPSGETASYGDLADKTGRPARAVGGACGRNPIPIVIPCHRVVGADGSMTGYSGKGGVETKHWLLRHEGALLL